MVSAIRHAVVMPHSFQTILEITKDSTPTSYVERDSDTAEGNEYSGFTNYLNDLVG